MIICITLCDLGDLGDHLYHFSDEKKRLCFGHYIRGEKRFLPLGFGKKKRMPTTWSIDLQKKNCPSPTFRASKAGTLVRAF